MKETADGRNGGFAVFFLPTGICHLLSDNGSRKHQEHGTHNQCDTGLKISFHELSLDGSSLKKQ